MARPRSQKPADNGESFARALRDFEEDLGWHNQFVENVDKSYRAYKGVMEMRSKAATWTNHLHPPYIFQIGETMIAGVADTNPRWKVKARPYMDSDMQEILQLQQGAKANELLLSLQVDCDNFAQKQIPFAKQAFIAGISVWKTYWRFEERRIRSQQVGQKEVEADDGSVITIPTLQQVSKTRTTADEPTAEIVDVRDWIPHQAAVSVDRAKRVTHRLYYTFEELKQLEAQGIYRNVDDLRETKGITSSDYGTGVTTRENDLFQIDRTKDMVEVLEQYRREEDGSISITSIGNRRVLLRDKMPLPFWHGQFPFVVCTPVPDLFRIFGVSTVDQLVDLQEMLWSTQNQRLDNTELLNNAIVLIREDAEDFDGFEWAPGAQWVVSDPNQVDTLRVTPLPAEVSFKAEAQVKADLQDIPGASPALMGQISPGDTTATEASLSTSNAMRRFQMIKQQFRWANKKVGEQWMELNQQFIRSDRLIPMIGRDGATAFEVIKPEILQGSYYVDVEATDESLMRSERRAEAQAKLQVAIAGAPVFAAVQQPLNLKAFMEDYLESFDTADPDRYFSQQPQPQLPPGQPQQGQPQAPQPGGAGGITSTQAYDANSPSHALTNSPVAAQQRMAAMTGGPVNV